MIYIIGTLSTLLLTYIAVNIDRSKYISYFWGCFFKRLFILLSIMPLAIISAVRYEVGTDFLSYSRIFKRVNIRNVDMEIGFYLFIQVLRKISENPQIFFAVTSCIICSLYIYAIYKNSINPVYSILIFVINGDYFFSMNGIRQAMAMTIVLFTLPYIRERKWIKTLAIVFIASLFHKSAFIIILLYIVVAIEWKPIVYALILMSTFIFANLSKILIIPFLQKFTTYGRFFLQTSRYYESNIDWGRFLIYLSFFLFMSYEHKVICKNINLKIMYSAAWIAVVIIASGVAMPTTVIRLALYMNPIIAIYTPDMVRCIAKGQLKILINFLIIFLYSIVCIIYINNGWYGVMPYKTFWNL